MRILRNAHMNESELEKVSMINYNVRKSIEHRSVFAFAFLPSFCPYMVFQLKMGKIQIPVSNIPHTSAIVFGLCSVYRIDIEFYCFLFGVYLCCCILTGLIFFNCCFKVILIWVTYTPHHHNTSNQTKPCTYANYCYKHRRLSIYCDFLRLTNILKSFSFHFPFGLDEMVFFWLFISSRNFAIASFINIFSLFPFLQINTRSAV